MAGNVLIYGPMLASAPNEQTLAVAAGHTVTVVTAAQWSAMTTAQFASYDAIIIPDNGCSTFEGNSDPNLAVLNATKAVWSPAVTGKIYLLGADPVLHRQGQYQLLLTNAINFVTNSGGTGLYYCLSCNWHSQLSGTPINFLSSVVSATVSGFSGDNVNILEPTHPTMAGITNAGLSNWHSTSHGIFISYSSLLNIANVNGSPFIVASPATPIYSITCPANTIVNTTLGSCTATVNNIDPVVLPNTANYSYTLSGATTGSGSGSASGLIFNKGETTVTYNLDDDPTKTCNFTVTVNDNQVPIVTCPGNQTLNVIANTCAANYTIADPISDNCTGATWGYVLSGATTASVSGIADGTGSGTLSFNGGITTVTLSGTDGTNAATTCSFTVSVNDNQQPVISYPSNITINSAAGLCNAVVTYSVTMTDNCSGQSATATSLSGDISNTDFDNATSSVFSSTIQATRLTFTTSGYAHSHGNPLNVYVDVHNPVTNTWIQVFSQNIGSGGQFNFSGLEVSFSSQPVDQIRLRSNPGQNQSFHNWGGSTFTLRDFSLVTTPMSGSTFNVGTTTVSSIATDGAGNTVTCSFTVTVVDNEDPTITCPVAATGNTNDDGTGNCTTTVSLGTPTTGDNCHVASVKAYIGTTEINPATNLFATGQTTVTWKVTDDADHTAQCNQLVTVRDNEKPVITCPPDSPYTKSTNEGLCTYKIDKTEFDVTAYDNCTAVSFSWSVTGATTNSGTGSMADVDLNFGENTITWTATDTAGNESICSITVNVNKVTTTTAVTVTPITQQYSDKVSFQATVTPYNCAGAGAIGGKVVFKIGDLVMGQADVVSGIAILSDVSLVEDHIYDDDSNPTHGPLKPDSNSKTVTAHFVDYDTDYNVTDATTNLTISCEDADVSYNGQSFFTVNPNNLSGTVVLSDYVVDRNDGANTRGDIRNATATFENGIGGTVLGTDNLRVGLVNPLNFQEGFVSTSFNTTLTGNEASNGGRVYDVYSRVNNYYCGTTDGITPVTLAMPGADYVTGGGHLVFGSNSGGKYAGTLGKKMNFGFVMKWNKSGKNLQGKVNVIYRRVDNGIPKVYQIKGTAIASLVVENVNDAGSVVTGSAIKFRRATIVTKANLTDVTNPLVPISLGGNYDLVMTAWESTTVNTGSLDKVGVQLSGSGSVGLLFSSNWVSGKTVAQTISGGKVQVRNSSTATSAKTVNDLSIIKEKTNKSAELTPFSVKAYPNPSHNEFSLIVEGSSKEKMEVMVYDIFGRMVSHIKNSDNNFIRFGKELPFGYYIAIVKQGNNQETIKLIKLE